MGTSTGHLIRYVIRLPTAHSPLFTISKGCLVGRVCMWFGAVVLPVVVAMVPASQVNAADPPPLKIGLPESMFNGLPQSVVGPASKPFQTMFEKQTGLKGEIVVVKD